MNTSVDKGLDPADIDALYLGNFTNDFFVRQSHWGAILSDSLGLVPKPATRTEGACASSALAFREGVFAIASGFYDVVLVGGVEDMSKAIHRRGGGRTGIGGKPIRAQGGINVSGRFRRHSNRILREIRRVSRAPDECNDKEPRQCTSEPQSPVQPRYSRYDGRQG